MLTQTAERQELLREIDTLPDSSVTAMLGFLRSLRSRNETSDWVDPIETGTWNAETMKAVRDVEEGRAERFESKEALFKDLRLCEEEAKARRNAAYLGKLERGLREIEEGKGIAMTFEDWERRFCNG